MSGEKAAFSLRPRGAQMEALVELWAASWAQAMPDIDFSARRGWLRTRIVELEEAGATTLCACDAQGAIAGFVTVDPASGYLDQVAVAPHAKGSGAARALLDGARALAGRKLALEVNRDNARARRFYEREGFVVVGEGVNPASGLKTLRMREK